MHRMKKNHKFFPGKNYIVKQQDNSKKFYNVEENQNVSFINARRNTRTFNEQSSSNFGQNANSFNKHINSKSHNKNRFHKNNNSKNNHQRNNNQNNFPAPVNTQKGKYQNPEIERYISALNVKDPAIAIQAILEQFLKIDMQKLHAIDEKLLDEAIVANNKELVELAIIAYAYRKLVSKKHIFYSPNWKKFKDKTMEDLKQAIELSKKPDHIEYSKKIKEIQADIESTDKLLGHFIHDIVFNARAKLASSAYASGLSMSQATNLLSADKDLVMELIGQTKISDEDSVVIGKTLKEKVDILKQITAKEKPIQKIKK